MSITGVTTSGFDPNATPERAGNKPSVADILTLIGKEATPLISAIGRNSKAINFIHSWNSDKLREPKRKPLLEISEHGRGGASTKFKRQNAIENFNGIVEISWNAEKVQTYGNQTEKAWEIAKETKSLAKDLEVAVLGLLRDPNAKTSILMDYVAGDENNGIAGEMAGIFHYIALGETAFTSSTINGLSCGKRGNILAFDSSGDMTGAAVVFTREHLLALLRQIWETSNGTMDAIDIFLGPDLKDAVDTLVVRQWKGEKSISEYASTIETPYGKATFNLSNFLTDSYGLGDVLLAGIKDGATIADLQSRVKELATTHTSERTSIFSSCTLEVRAPHKWAAAFGLKPKR